MMRLRYIISFVLAVSLWASVACSARSTGKNLYHRATSYWVSSIERNGKPAFNGDPNYKIFRNFKDYGAIGDGNAEQSTE